MKIIPFEGRDFHPKSVPNYRSSISSSQGRVAPMSGSAAFHGGATGTPTMPPPSGPPGETKQGLRA